MKIDEHGNAVATAQTTMGGGLPSAYGTGESNTGY